MSRDIVSKRLLLNTHVANKTFDGDVHLAITNTSRLANIKNAYPNLPTSLRVSSIFCAHTDTAYRASTSSGKKYTESPTRATCSICLTLASEWGYGEDSFGVDDGKGFRLSKNSIHGIKNWIPDSCQIVVSSKSIKVIDSVTKEEIGTDSMDKACTIVAEKCYKAFNSEDVIKNTNIFTKKIFDFSNNQYIVQGLNINEKKQKFDGFILKASKSNSLVNLTFDQLFTQGYHFEDGTPCGECNKDRKTLVKTDVESDGIGLNIVAF